MGESGSSQSVSASEVIWDAMIVGSGAAGMMCAIHISSAGKNVLLLDSQKKPGAKILMSGGTRCNVTNRDVSEKDFASENIRFVRHVLKAFSSREAIEFFEDAGVSLVIEEGGKYFPSTHSAQTILDALLSKIKNGGATLTAQSKVTDIQQEGTHFRISGNHFNYLSRAVVLCTGGLSYPTTGSDGTGYRISKNLGHSLIPTSPALTPLLTDDGAWKSLMGISLPVVISLWVQGRKHEEFRGPFLFTHFGFSGPAVLNMSRFWERANHPSKEIRVSFLPDFREDAFEQDILQTAQVRPHLKIQSLLSEILPDRLAEAILSKAQINGELKIHQVQKAQRQRLIQTLFHCRLSMTGVFGYRKAEVTAGGIDFGEIDSATLQSKIIPGLFFAGEILDADGRIGGFNFQWAWSSAVVAARGVIQHLR